MVAMATLPALAIDMDEATSLAHAIERVREYYPVTLGLSDKHMALVALAITAGRIYGKRALVIVGTAGATAPPPPGDVETAGARHMPDLSPSSSSAAQGWFAPDATTDLN